MDNRPIGVFDSGVGGLTAVRELHKILPGEDIIYFGDTARVPYGTRSAQIIRRFTRQIMGFLGGFDVKAVVVACGTISSNVEPQELAGLGVPCFTVVPPAAREAAQATKSGRVGVMATPATIRTGAFDREIAALLPAAEVFGQACPLLVPLVENGLYDFENKITRLALEMYMAPLLDAGVDTIILGCTHYPLLYELASDIAGPGVTLVDAGAAAARSLKAALDEQGLRSSRQSGKSVYYVTDTVESFLPAAKNFLFGDIAGESRHVALETLERTV